jgi:YidC/Oxa1 family membrane protein insertase
MERRVLIAVFLSFIVLYLYQAFFVPVPPAQPPAKASPQSEAAGRQAAPAPAPAETPAAGAETAAAVKAPAAPAAPAVVAATSEQSFTVETRIVRAVFSNRGGVLVSWQLKNFLDDQKQPLDLVPHGLARAVALPFSLAILDEPEKSQLLNTALFRVSGSGSTIDGRSRPVHLSFEYEDAAGLRARKDFVLQPDSYVIDFNASVTQGGQVFNPTMQWGPGLGGQGTAGESSRYMQKAEGILFRQGSIDRIAFKQVAARPVFEGDIPFGGIDDHYFASITLPVGKKMRLEYEPLSVPGPQQNQPIELVGYSAKMSQATPGMRVFAGPKDFDVLKAVNPDLVRIINFGIFSWLAVPLLRALKSTNGYTHNFGWAIVILTILINAVMFPLRHKSMVSMRKMQKIQPEIKAIQAHYSKLKATDPARQKMNAEMMNLYREKGVNPASGCLPMLLTMPVLFGFYEMLGQAIEVRGAPWVLWIHDLSRHDPYYVLPVLMGLTMFWQQKMTPSTVDPAQQKMMLIMPVVFTVFFLWAPSGLALYFLLSNLLAIGQQYVTNRLTAPAPAPVRLPAGKGRRDVSR